jgi:hypothetical protein
MSVEAYVFIDCEHGKAREVAEKMTKVGGVESVKTVTGPHDIIAYQAIDGVKRTLTNVVVE